MSHPHVTSEQFLRACSRFATGITVTTVVGPEGKPYGMTANSFTSVSLRPPLVLICVDHKAQALPAFRHSSHFAISVLSHAQREVSVRFATVCEDRFEGVPWRTGVSGAPLIEGALAVFECEVENRVDAGDHLIVIGRVIACEAHAGEPLLYFGSKYAALAAGAPTPKE